MLRTSNAPTPLCAALSASASPIGRRSLKRIAIISGHALPLRAKCPAHGRIAAVLTRLVSDSPRCSWCDGPFQARTLSAATRRTRSSLAVDGRARSQTWRCRVRVPLRSRHIVDTGMACRRDGIIPPGSILCRSQGGHCREDSLQRARSGSETHTRLTFQAGGLGTAPRRIAPAVPFRSPTNLGSPRPSAGFRADHPTDAGPGAGGTAMGYYRRAFDDAFGRYLPAAAVAL
jgi:hypothetical protein